MKLLISIISLIIFGNCKPEHKTEQQKEINIEQPLETFYQEIDSIKYELEWLSYYTINNTLINRVSLPKGYSRKPLEINSFGHWIRRLPLKEGNPPVLLYNGEHKRNQEAHAFVVDLDIGKRDLQQCADAAMRIRAEYLFHTKQFDKIHFNYTNGALVPYSKWRNGYYPIPKDKSVSWVKKDKCNQSYRSFKTYLIQIFNFAGTHSLSKELTAVPFMNMQIGDLLIKGGFPGHAVMVVDMVEDLNGNKKYLLAQSYMPAQNFQILKNPENNLPWYELKNDNSTIITPEWAFDPSQLMRWN